MGLFGAVAQYAQDTLCIVRSPQSWSRRMRLWLRLNALAAGFRGGSLLGFQVTRFSGSTLLLLYREIFARQSYLFTARSPRPLILDCGANIGMSVLYFKWLYPHAEIRAFEPEPRTCAALQENVARNRLADVAVHNIALWDTAGRLDLFVPGDQGGSLVASAHPARRGGTAVSVPCARLSSFIEREVDFLKIDVEGAELRILTDLAQAGKLQLIRQMVIEYHHNIPAEPAVLSRLLHLLEDAGFTYQMSAWSFPLVAEQHFQDVLIGAVRGGDPRVHVRG